MVLRPSPSFPGVAETTVMVLPSAAWVSDVKKLCRRRIYASAK